MTKVLRRRYETAAVAAHKAKLAESIALSRAKLSTYLCTANTELSRVDSELSLHQSQLGVLRDSRERLAKLATEISAQIAALGSVLPALK